MGPPLDRSVELRIAEDPGKLNPALASTSLVQLAHQF